MSLDKAVKVRKSMMNYQDQVYMNLIQQVNTKCKEILTDDLGNQFVSNCGRDIAGEVVRSYFDTSDYNITVDQMARRIFEFDYKNEYDPLVNNESIKKDVYNYNDSSSSTLTNIIDDLDAHQTKLFEKEEYTDSNGKTKTHYKDRLLINKKKREYAESQKKDDGTIFDEYTGEAGEYVTDKNGNHRRRQEVDHTQSLNAATYNSKFIKEKGIQELKEMMNSDDNFAMMDKSANSSKGDARVKDTKVFDKDGRDITHRATPEELATAICEQWEKENKGSKTSNLKDKGYLNEDGKVPKAVKQKLIENIKRSQNAESKVILKNTDYGKVGVEAAVETSKSFSKIVAGQLIYYGAPPLFYEIKKAFKSKNNGLDDVINKICVAGKRVGKYLFSKMKNIFKNILDNTLKKLVKTFMDILINMVKATIKKMMKMAKQLVMATLDAIKIIASKEASKAEKADSVTKLYAVVVTSLVVEVLFEIIEKGLKIPEWLLKPLQILTTVICTNATMLVLEKADLFDVKLGFKINKIKEVFSVANQEYDLLISQASDYSNNMIQQIIIEARETTLDIYNSLNTFDPYNRAIKDDLRKVSELFNMNIQFDKEWLDFIGD